MNQGPIEHALEAVQNAQPRLRSIVEEVRVNLFQEIDGIEEDAEILDTVAAKKLSNEMVDTRREVGFLLDRYETDVADLLRQRANKLQDRLDELALQ